MAVAGSKPDTQHGEGGQGLTQTEHFSSVLKSPSKRMYTLSGELKPVSTRKSLFCGHWIILFAVVSRWLDCW